ncbi:MAG: DNA polymerase III subunit gamma/tau, partial [Acidimicrobiia bacterium]|nr:DNA polymerase III subunit gamma/tau [Acidimicrobiia bacterium]
MAHQSLYRRYRSQRFSEILGQPHVTTGLQSAVAEGREGHAYLFSGPRGTGKTSTARVLAKALNCENLKDGEPCCECASCKSIESGNSFDIHELDAASHNKVDDIRELIGKVHLGTPGRTKVYILDEVHMLSSGAENALLKTLEEPPEHVVFVLATTEPQKVVSTIRSRTQHFQFHLLPADVLAEHLRWVIADAGLDVSEEGIEFALRQGGGSARDTLSALDLVVAAGGVPSGGEVAELLVRAIGDRDPARAMASIQEGLEFGREPRTIGEDALDLLRNAFLSAMGAPLAHLSDRQQEIAAQIGSAIGAAGLTRALESIGQALVEMRQAPDPRVPLEVTVLRLARAGGSSSPGADAGDTAGLQARIETLEARIADLEARIAADAPSTFAGTAPAVAPPAGRLTIPRPGQAPAGSPDDAATPTVGTPARPPRPPRPGGGPPRSPRAGTAPPPPQPQAPRPESPAAGAG